MMCLFCSIYTLTRNKTCKTFCSNCSSAYSGLSVFNTSVVTVIRSQAEKGNKLSNFQTSFGDGDNRLFKLYVNFNHSQRTLYKSIFNNLSVIIFILVHSRSGSLPRKQHQLMNKICLSKVATSTVYYFRFLWITAY